MSKNLLAFFMVLSLSGFAKNVFAKTDIEFILDASGSMRAAMEGKTQIAVAKQSIKTAIESVTPDTQVALRVYAHRVEQDDKAKSCLDSELVIPLGPLNKADFSAKVDLIQPKGYTPIAYSLSQAPSDFGPASESEKVIILVSDGEETCGGDPVQVVRDLLAKGFKVKVNTIGFNADAKAQVQLKLIAAAGGGQYYDAKDAATLASSLKDVTQKAVLVNKPTSVYGTEIQGGNAYESAVQLPVGQELRLNHHQRKSEYDYFYVDLKAGQSLSFTMTTGDKGITIQGATVQENDNPYAGFQIHDATRNKIGGEELIGVKNSTKAITVDVPVAGRYYILIGSIYDSVNKNVTFKGEVKGFYDAGSDSDAGSTPETALTIQKQSYPENYITAKDESDMFKLTTTSGERLAIKIIPENPKAMLMATLMDDLRAEIGKGQSPNEGAGFRVNATATGGVTTYLKVQRSMSDAPTKYSIQFETAMAETAPTTQPTATVPPVTPAPPAVSQPAVAPTESTEKVILHEIHETQVKWTAAKNLKVLAGVFGIGLLLGLVLGFVLKRSLVKKID